MVGSVLMDWQLDLPAIAVAGGVTVLYLRGAGLRVARGFPRPRRTASFLAGVTVVLLSQLGPAAVWSEVLFWPHMVQHLLLTLVAAPLLAHGVPLTTVRAALPPGPRAVLVGLARTTRRARRDLGAPPPLVLATLAHVAAVWLWHWPLAYDAAVTNPTLHLIEHATFLATAVWFWSEVRATRRRGARTQGLATLCFATMIVQGAVLGALLTFAGRSLYAVYDGGAGLTALEDQQLAGALMWVPPGFVHGTLAVRRFAAWLGSAEHDLAVRERSGSPSPSPHPSDDAAPGAIPRPTVQ
jgi:putative membrane protein